MHRQKKTKKSWLILAFLKTTKSLIVRMATAALGHPLLPASAVFLVLLRRLKVGCFQNSKTIIALKSNP
ncbi:membrane or secreted protein [Christiangramia forsetii KT0803]|uniref:Membrane or secreted protein n=1 Tax=Christiangramia forsetii (strain DSM 17595 / CGMCC 1.15422 / KT0803) TaxID=411154 RepID=A0M5I0_CHRFK|nr:membrane or secreted protein [Christiangramia forsetii KT0803]